MANACLLYTSDAADEQPVLAADDDGRMGTIGEVVAETQIAVLHVTIQC